MITKKNWPFFFFTGEIILWMLYYGAGSNGIVAMMQLNKDNLILTEEIATLSESIRTIEQRIESFNTDSFYREKIAREQLHMARPDEIIYYIDN